MDQFPLDNISIKDILRAAFNGSDKPFYKNISAEGQPVLFKGNTMQPYTNTKTIGELIRQVPDLMNYLNIPKNLTTRDTIKAICEKPTITKADKNAPHHSIIRLHVHFKKLNSLIHKKLNKALKTIDDIKQTIKPKIAIKMKLGQKPMSVVDNVKQLVNDYEYSQEEIKNLIFSTFTSFSAIFSWHFSVNI